MRIALVAESFYPAVDGTTTTVKAVADHLVEAGHRVLLVAPAPGLGSYRGARVVRVRRPRRSDQVRAALAEFGPELVHVTSPGPLGRRALEHARALGARTLVAQQTPVPSSYAETWRAKVGERADAVVVTSAWMTGQVERLGVRPRLWQPGVDTRAFGPQLRDDFQHARWARAGAPDGPRVVVGFVGALERRHHVADLAQLASLPGTRLVVVGDGSQRRWLSSRLPDARFTGPLGTGDLTRALAAFDVLVHPGRRETCCHSLREAAASGVPVVAPAAGGAVDVVRPLQTGLLYDPGRPLGLAEAVAAVAADPRRALLGARGRELAVRRDWHAAVTELVDRHYAPLLGRGATGPSAA
ncbi:glycosyltransferase [Nocardioides sp. GCM10027113]|uniref:glycosyltransferase n=1 Tax=unclassified Nocardioides TaxID=2615069 RepID=UPI003611DF05